MLLPKNKLRICLIQNQIYLDENMQKNICSSSASYTPHVSKLNRMDDVNNNEFIQKYKIKII
jgi:hypothetical protein